MTSAFTRTICLLGLAIMGGGTVACSHDGTSALPIPSAISSSAQPPGGDPALVAAIRAATAKFQNIDVALQSGYIDDGFGCIDATVFGLPASDGAMGFHLINWSLHDDPETDPLRPDLLVYEPAASPGAKPKLVALEYEVFRPDWYGAGHTDPPTLLGQEFESFDFDGLEIFGLHLWLWRDNPAGMFADFNPKVRCR